MNSLKEKCKRISMSIETEILGENINSQKKLAIKYFKDMTPNIHDFQVKKKKDFSTIQLLIY